VSGNVKRPGEYPYEAGLTVNSVIEKAGGVDGEAVRELAVVRRDTATSPSNPDVIRISRELAAGDTVLQPGDMLNVAAYKSSLIAPSVQKVLGWISTGNFDNVVLAYEGPLRASAFESKLRMLWQAFERQAGTFERQLEVRTELRGMDYVGIVNCQFSRGRGDVQVVFNRGGAVIDVSITSSTP
jgi:hypothetical protein